MQDTQIIIRAVLLGSKSVGKSSLCGQFNSHHFSGTYEPTDSLNTFRTLTLVNKLLILLQIDDLFPINHFSLVNSDSSNTENRQIFENIVENKRTKEIKKKNNPVFAEKAVDSIVFIFDLSNKESFELIEKMISYVFTKEQERIGEKHPRLTNKVLVGNKSDIATNAIKMNDIERIKKSYGLKYIKTSALTNKNVNELFEDLCKEIIDEKFELDMSHHSTIDSEFGIEEPPASDFLAWCDCSRRSKTGQVCNTF